MSYRYLQWILWLIGLTLQCLVMSAMRHGMWREFPLVFLCVLSLTATTIGDIVAQQIYGHRDHAYYLFYWGDELLRHTAIFSVIVSLAAGSLLLQRSRRMLARLVVAAGFAFWLFVLLFNRQDDVNAWMSIVVRNLSFGSAVLDFGLWFLLISAAEKDIRRLLLVGGLGIQMTGEALGQSLRFIFPQFESQFVAMLFAVCSHFLCLLIWWQAMSPHWQTAERVDGHHA